MNVIILSPHFPPNHINYARALKAYGDTALGIGDSPWICDELRDTLDEYVYVPDMTNYDAMLRAVAYLTSKYGKIDRIDSQNEFWLGIESQLREDFNIFGQKPAQTDINRSKLEMKRVARAAGIPVAEGMEVEDVHQLREFAKKVGFPLVVKPVVGVGASATYPLNNEDDIEHCFEYIHGRYIVEQYIHGDIVTFDGFVDRHGRIIFKTSHEYNAGVMECVNEAQSIYYFNVTEIDPLLEALGRKCVAAFDVRERFFHIEWFRTAKNPTRYCFLEINVRPPGLYTLDMMNYSADIDLYRAWAGAFHESYPYVDAKLKYSVGFAGRRVNVHHKHSNEEILSQFSDCMVKAEPVPGAYSDAMGEFYFLVRHPDKDRVLEILKYILEVADD
ncbi:MAG: ATP-grasp domain-containing protein [Proteobacteria bacterium]|nr:ATP-grasp domain-containing protein [Pseudomonadota bacterium]